MASEKVQHPNSRPSHQCFPPPSETLYPRDFLRMPQFHQGTAQPDPTHHMTGRGCLSTHARRFIGLPSVLGHGASKQHHRHTPCQGQSAHAKTQRQSSQDCDIMIVTDPRPTNCCSLKAGRGHTEFVPCDGVQLHAFTEAEGLAAHEHRHVGSLGRQNRRCTPCERQSRPVGQNGGCLEEEVRGGVLGGLNKEPCESVEVKVSAGDSAFQQPAYHALALPLRAGVGHNGTDGAPLGSGVGEDGGHRLREPERHHAAWPRAARQLLRPVAHHFVNGEPDALLQGTGGAESRRRRA